MQTPTPAAARSPLRPWSGLEQAGRAVLGEARERTPIEQQRDQLLAALKRTTFLLNSSRLVIDDQLARDVAGEAVDHARQLIADVESPAEPQASAAAATSDKPQPPAIGQHWPGQGGIYVGVCDGQHLILCTLLPAGDLTWGAAIDWAKALSAGDHRDWSLPSRAESRVLYANVRDQFERAWYWTSAQYSALTAWTQWFDDGYQDLSAKDNEGRARAVRRLPL